MLFQLEMVTGPMDLELRRLEIARLLLESTQPVLGMNLKLRAIIQLQVAFNRQHPDSIPLRLEEEILQQDPTL